MEKQARVTIHVPDVLSRFTGGEKEILVAAETVGEALEALFAVHPQLRPRVLDDAERIHPYLLLITEGEQLDRGAFAHHPVSSGDEIDILPAVEGGGPPRDVRFRGFASRTPVAEAQAVALSELVSRLEIVDLDAAAGRILGEDFVSAHAAPPFDRSAMDGYAVRAEDTYGASSYDPVSLRLVGESMPGATELPDVGPGEACRIMTGAPMPLGADAVLMAEDAREVGDRVEVEAPLPPAKNVGRTGEDVAAGDVVLRRGRRLRPQDLGLLASLGAGEVTVYARPRVVILVTGNELLPPGSAPRPGCIIDSNTPMLRALIRRDGGVVVAALRRKDDEALIRETLGELDADILITAGGSSVGREDFLPQLVGELGRLQVHGVAMRPAAPAGIGMIGDMKVFLLPGNPVSCLAAYDILAGPAVRRWGGRPHATDFPYPRRRMTTRRAIASVPGRLDYVRVGVEGDSVHPLAAKGAAILSSTTRADGFLLVPEEKEGLEEGAAVTVYFYDPAPDRL